MKTLGRILIILIVFSLILGITYVIVGSRSASDSGTRQGFEPGNAMVVPQDGAPVPANGGLPEFPGGERNEFRGEPGAGGWLLGMIKNIGIIAVIVPLIVVHKSWTQTRKRAAQNVVG